MCSLRRGVAGDDGWSSMTAPQGPMTRPRLHALRWRLVPHAGPIRHKIGEASVVTVMASVMVGRPRLGQQTARRDEAVDPPLRSLVPTDVEGGKLRKELQFAVGQMV